MEHDVLRLTTLFPSVIQRFHNKICIWAGRHGPANNTTSVKIQHNGQVAPTLATPDISDVTTPDLIGLA